MTVGIFEDILWPEPDISGMKERRDVNGLIRALRHPDLSIQEVAAEALGQLGPDAVDRLLAALGTRSKSVRLGIIEALGQCHDSRAIPAIGKFLWDKDNEIRWEAALALGEIGDPCVFPDLSRTLRDEDKYVRYGAALALTKLGYAPDSPEERAFLALGLQNWVGLAWIGQPAIEALGTGMKDHHPEVRAAVVEAAGKIGSPDATPVVYRGLRDSSEDVRWAAVIAAPKCGIDLMYLPRGLSRRPRNRKNPNIAAFLNFLLPGIGYFYIGLWWGILIFQVDVYFTMWLFTTAKLGLFTWEYLFPAYALFAMHAWYLARKMPDL